MNKSICGFFGVFYAYLYDLLFFEQDTDKQDSKIEKTFNEKIPSQKKTEELVVPKTTKSNEEASVLNATADKKQNPVEQEVI